MNVIIHVLRSTANVSKAGVGVCGREHRHPEASRTWVSQEESSKGVMGVVGQAGLFPTGEKVF